MKHVVSNSSLVCGGGFVNRYSNLAEQSRIVRLPLNKIGSINKINKMYALLEQSNERPPSAEKLQKNLT
jgi:DNA-directed RNA polymerase sigma subunit (sigma70/sigma32)